MRRGRVQVRSCRGLCRPGVLGAHALALSRQLLQGSNRIESIRVFILALSLRSPFAQKLRIHDQDLTAALHHRELLVPRRKDERAAGYRNRTAQGAPQNLGNGGFGLAANVTRSPRTSFRSTFSTRRIRTIVPLRSAARKSAGCARRKSAGLVEDLFRERHAPPGTFFGSARTAEATHRFPRPPTHRRVPRWRSAAPRPVVEPHVGRTGPFSRTRPPFRPRWRQAVDPSA